MCVHQCVCECGEIHCKESAMSLISLDGYPGLSISFCMHYLKTTPGLKILMRSAGIYDFV